jgi:FMN reductase
MAGNKSPYIVAIGGTLRANSSTERALRFTLAAAEKLGAKTTLISGSDLDLPMYAPEALSHAPPVLRLVDEVRKADGIMLGSPGYHGGISGLVKNAIDYIEELSRDARPYLQDRPVGLVATGAGWQGAVVTLTALRGIVHALRGWPTPLGVPINTIEPVFDKDGACIAPKIADQLNMMAAQVVEFARTGAPAAQAAI